MAAGLPRAGYSPPPAGESGWSSRGAMMTTLQLAARLDALFLEEISQLRQLIFLRWTFSGIDGLALEFTQLSNALFT
jgi:hypothetical protein